VKGQEVAPSRGSARVRYVPLDIAVRAGLDLPGEYQALFASQMGRGADTERGRRPCQNQSETGHQGEST
jgi:hypothetical protein